MAILLKHKKHIITRLLPLVLFIIIIGALPIIIGYGGAFFSELFTGKPCSNEANCKWYGFLWYVMASVPVAFILIAVLALVVLIDFILYKRKTNTNEK